MKSRLLPFLLLPCLLATIPACKPRKKVVKLATKGSPMRGAPMRGAPEKEVEDTKAETPKKEDAPKKQVEDTKKVEETKKETKIVEAAPAKPKEMLKAVTDKPKTDEKAQVLKIDEKKSDDGEENRIPRTNKKKKATKDYQKKFAALGDLKKGDKSLPPFLGFGTLSDFEYEVHWGVAKKDLPKQIPDKVLAYNGKKVRTRGYMLPLKMSEEGQVQICFLLRDLGPCCFGGTPKMNYWVLVTIPEGTKASYKAYRSVEITGTISIGEKVEYDRVTSIYRMNATKVDWDE